MPQTFDELTLRKDQRKAEKERQEAQKKKLLILSAAVMGAVVLLLLCISMFPKSQQEPEPVMEVPAVTEAEAIPILETIPATEAVAETEPVQETEAVQEPEIAAPTEPPVPEAPLNVRPELPELIPMEPTDPVSGRILYDEVPLYFQTDYPNTRYGRGTVKSHGCGITSLAMVASYLTGHEYLPDELAKYFGGYGQSNIQKLEYGSDKLQLPWKKAKNIHEITDALQEGQIAILLMNEESIFTEGSHFIVVTGINEDGLYTIHDPYEPNYEIRGLKEGFESGFEEYAIYKGYDGGWIYDVNAMPEEPFIYEEIRPYVEPRYTGIELTAAEELLLAKVIWVEARGESAEGQQAVAEVILNRMMAEDYPDTLSGVIYDTNQFLSVEHLEKAEPEQAQFDAIEDALLGPYILPLEVVHFSIYPANEYVWGTIGAHTFCYRWGLGPEATE